MPTPTSPPLLRPARRTALGLATVLAVAGAAACSVETPTAGGSVEVQVLSNECGDDGCLAAPAVGAEVELLLGSSSVDNEVTDADGIARFHTDSVGVFEVVAHVGDVSSLPSEVSVDGGGALTDVAIMVQAPGGP
ncbi:hypothetical protein [Isoptericola sp. NPDC057653]|uniref:hypothetical protein n=1 Tax=Isoptericola sp. NPDC057653 TaxID=3346195 RepID=UPI0036AE15AD